MSTSEASTVQEQIEKQFIELCDRNRDAMIQAIRLIVSIHAASNPSDDHHEENSRQILAKIRSKEFISVNEAALLFDCSAQHLRNLVQHASDGKSAEPIPFRDLGGLVRLPVNELLAWARKPMPRNKKAKRKSQLKVVAS